MRGIAFFVISQLSIRNRFWTPFWTFPGSFGGAFWPPRWLQPVLRFLLERPRAAQRIFFSAPRGEKEGSKKGAKKRGKKVGYAGSRWIQDGFKRECPAECAGPVLAHLSLLRPEYSARSWKHAQHHQRWAADRSRAFRRAWDLGSRALGEGAFSKET